MGTNRHILILRDKKGTWLFNYMVTLSAGINLVVCRNEIPLLFKCIHCRIFGGYFHLVTKKPSLLVRDRRLLRRSCSTHALQLIECLKEKDEFLYLDRVSETSTLQFAYLQRKLISYSAANLTKTHR